MFALVIPFSGAVTSAYLGKNFYHVTQDTWAWSLFTGCPADLSLKRFGCVDGTTVVVQPKQQVQLNLTKSEYPCHLQKGYALLKQFIGPLGTDTSS